MTLGRSSTGAIKIKTDEAGGGLRAVECACCEVSSDPCVTTLMQNDLVDIVQNATSVAVSYVFPDFFNTGYPGAPDPPELAEGFSGESGPISWDGSASGFWESEEACSPGSVCPSPSLEVYRIGKYLKIIFFHFAYGVTTIRTHNYPGINRPSFPCDPNPDDPQTGVQLFTINVNGFDLPAWQDSFSSIPPGIFPAPTMSLTFS